MSPSEAAADGEAKLSSKGRPYRTVLVEDYEILVGRSSQDNDALSLRVATGKDLWLHIAGGTPGSHVVVRNPSGAPIPASVLKGAAQLAAWYSKARSAGRVAVHYCWAKDVSKPRGAPAGLVQIKNFKSITVVPQLVAAPQDAAPNDEQQGDE